MNGPDAGGGNPNAFVFPPGTNVQVTGSEWRQNNPRNLQLQGSYGRVLRSVCIGHRTCYEVMFEDLATGHLLPATDLTIVGSMTYDNHCHDQNPPTQDDRDDDSNLFPNHGTSWYNRTEQEELRDPAGFTDIISQSAVRIVNFGRQHEHYNLNGQIATVLYYDRNTRLYCVAPCCAPHKLPKFLES